MSTVHRTLSSVIQGEWSTAIFRLPREGGLLPMEAHVPLASFNFYNNYEVDSLLDQSF